MTTRKGEREEALELAKRVIDTWGDGNPPIVQLARALLSSAKAEAEMREALEALLDDAITKHAWVGLDGDHGVTGCTCAYHRARAALSKEPG